MDCFKRNRFIIYLILGEFHYLLVLPVDYNRVPVMENDWNCRLLGQEWRAQVVQGMSCN
jgi:hypothetical protein